MIFHIITNGPTVEADTAKNAARQYALEQGIVSGEVKVSSGVKVFNIEDTPRDVKATEV